LKGLLPTDGIIFREENKNFISVDWICSTPQSLAKILPVLGVGLPTHKDLKDKLASYIEHNNLGNRWKESMDFIKTKTR